MPSYSQELVHQDKFAVKLCIKLFNSFPYQNQKTSCHSGIIKPLPVLPENHHNYSNKPLKKATICIAI